MIKYGYVYWWDFDGKDFFHTFDTEQERDEDIERSISTLDQLSDEADERYYIVAYAQGTLRELLQKYDKATIVCDTYDSDTETTWYYLEKKYYNWCEYKPILTTFHGKLELGQL